ncbi:hypothetical protein HMPREF0860_2121 [Treponema socranskii subsp. socranskii VPI DR56BR1116 = ATCC 35536]|uniref:Uncharacterized protein n=1 Tax=Treponema socranskii subsp. socranskii VPI DR56BR1116 = ATCC 35536 TaxID=1125725 RepID=A0ABN0P336_TRESO|nr:hypothetical protein HMPREF0860_2121 [Treponema socranskii subsp. socranskii VPI DR56BR1116 = ATCC 35536]
MRTPIPASAAAGKIVLFEAKERVRILARQNPRIRARYYF